MLDWYPGNIVDIIQISYMKGKHNECQVLMSEICCIAENLKAETSFAHTFQERSFISSQFLSGIVNKCPVREMSPYLLIALQSISESHIWLLYLNNVNFKHAEVWACHLFYSLNIFKAKITECVFIFAKIVLGKLNEK